MYLIAFRKTKGKEDYDQLYLIIYAVPFGPGFSLQSSAKDFHPNP